MTSGRNPSGLPSGRIVGPIYGPREIDVERRIGVQRDGLLRTRRTLLVAIGVALAFLAMFAIAGSPESAAGLALIWLVPLVFFLAVLQVIIAIVGQPKEPPARSGGSKRPTPQHATHPNR